jgi:hypothetical protein
VYGLPNAENAVLPAATTYAGTSPRGHRGAADLGGLIALRRRETAPAHRTPPRTRHTGRGLGGGRHDALADAEHFVRAPDWTWYILFYFFLAGLCRRVLLPRRAASPVRRSGDERPRVGYYVAFVAFLICPVLLTLDLGQTTCASGTCWSTRRQAMRSLIFKYWSPCRSVRGLL